MLVQLRSFRGETMVTMSRSADEEKAGDEADRDSMVVRGGKGSRVSAQLRAVQIRHTNKDATRQVAGVKPDCSWKQNRVTMVSTKKYTDSL